jgi:hypothetical protein
MRVIRLGTKRGAEDLTGGRMGALQKLHHARGRLRPRVGSTKPQRSRSEGWLLNWASSVFGQRLAEVGRCATGACNLRRSG